VRTIWHEDVEDMEVFLHVWFSSSECLRQSKCCKLEECALPLCSAVLGCMMWFDA